MSIYVIWMFLRVTNWYKALNPRDVPVDVAILLNSTLRLGPFDMSCNGVSDPQKLSILSRFPFMTTKTITVSIPSQLDPMIGEPCYCKVGCGIDIYREEKGRRKWWHELVQEKKWAGFDALVHVYYSIVIISLSESFILPRNRHSRNIYERNGTDRTLVVYLLSGRMVVSW